MQLTKVERLLLANQYRILSHLDPDSAAAYERLAEALEEGYDAAYQDLTLGRIYEVLPERECFFVTKVLDLHWAMQRSYDALEDKGEITEGSIKFPGFDGSSEEAYQGYAQFVVHRERKFEDLRVHNLDFNSRIPMSYSYQRMIAAWESVEPFERRYALTAEDIIAILEAG